MSKNSKAVRAGYANVIPDRGNNRPHTQTFGNSEETNVVGGGAGEGGSCVDFGSSSRLEASAGFWCRSVRTALKDLLRPDPPGIRCFSSFVANSLRTQFK